MLSVPTVIVVIILGVFALPYLGVALTHLQPLHGSLKHNWVGFVGIVLALSGVEAVANATGVMKLNPGSTLAAPNVTQTSTKALWVVLIEVVGFTALLGLAMMALPGLTAVHGEVNAPGAEGVRDYMLRYMGQVFIGHALGPVAGTVAAWAVSITFGLLLLSAVNTAIIDLISISFLMSKDEELPPIFAKLNQFGVPNFSLVVMSLIPAALVVWVGDVSGLADLYAVGVVGAIATNLGATATDWRLPLLLRERILMLVTFGVLFAIEVTLFIEKPRARVFVVTILAIGLILRGLAREYSLRKAARIKEKVDALPLPYSDEISVPESSGMPYTFQVLHSEVPCTSSASASLEGSLMKEKVDELRQYSVNPSEKPQLPSPTTAAVSLASSLQPSASISSTDLQYSTQHHGRPVLAAVRRLGKTLDFAVSETREGGKLLYVLFVREQPVIAPGDHKRKWQDDSEAKNIFENLKEKGLGESILLCYAVSDSPADTIADLASTIGAECVMIGASQRGALVNMLRGDMVTKLSKLIPEDMYLIVCG